jgi:hypothetical protein
MSAAPDPRRPSPRAEALPPLVDEPTLWAAAPLTAGRRDLRDWPEADHARLIDYYRPLARRRTRRHAEAVPHLIDRDEIDGYAVLWLVEALGTYDPARGLTFAGYLRAKIPQYLQQLARGGGSGRYVNDADIALVRARARSAAERQRELTAADVTAALGGDPAGAAQRLRAVALRRGVHHALEVTSIDIGVVAVRPDGGMWVYGDPGHAGEPDADLLARDGQRTATEALTHSMWNGDGVPKGDNVRGLWMFVLTEFDGHTKRDVAAVGGCSTRTVNTAIHALLEGARRRLEAA